MQAQQPAMTVLTACATSHPMETQNASCGSLLSAVKANSIRSACGVSSGVTEGL